MKSLCWTAVAIIIQATLWINFYNLGYQNAQSLEQTMAEFRGYKEAITNMTLTTEPNDLAGLCIIVEDYLADERNAL
ncbi:hypothetical protein [uncultured Kiloniella sp.]|uniref:hypothetical protein n=1 Tax=uncultured Kiloniella sp. TaxID=1133091 RepID=UPI0026367D9D|nr:hypothetical protein [uncultured Kiloniella sp.]